MIDDGAAAGRSAEVAESAKATLAGAISAARDLPDRAGAALTTTAQAAFVKGLRLCAALSAAASLALALFVSMTLRRPRPASEPAGPPPAI